jgi:hypothetical protein
MVRRLSHRDQSASNPLARSLALSVKLGQVSFIKTSLV